MDKYRSADNRIIRWIIICFAVVAVYAGGVLTEHDYFPEDIDRAHTVCEDKLLVFIASAGEVLGAECLDGSRYFFDTKPPSRYVSPQRATRGEFVCGNYGDSCEESRDGN